MGNLSFDKGSSKDKLIELIREHDDFIIDDTSITKANNLSINSWHMVDWVYEEFKEIHKQSNKGEFRNTLYPKCPELKIVHDIANSSKHKNLDRPKTSIKSAQKHNGAFSSAFSRDFDITILKIELEDESILYFIDVIVTIINFWKDYFKLELNIELD